VKKSRSSYDQQITLVIPAKVGTHLSDIPGFSGNGNTLPTLEGSCSEEMDPGFHRGDERIGGGGILSQALLRN